MLDEVDSTCNAIQDQTTAVIVDAFHFDLAAEEVDDGHEEIMYLGGEVGTVKV